MTPTTLRDLLARQLARHFGDAFMGSGHALARPHCESCRDATVRAIHALAANPETVEVLATALRHEFSFSWMADVPDDWWAKRAAALLRELTGEPE